MITIEYYQLVLMVAVFRWSTVISYYGHVTNFYTIATVGIELGNFRILRYMTVY
jgi:hypothetical protein